MYDGINIDRLSARYIEQKLTKLENLRLIWNKVPTENFKIHLKQLKTLTVEFKKSSWEVNIKIQNIEILNIAYNYTVFDDIKHIISLNNTAKYINMLNQFRSYKMNEFIDYVAKLRNLVELRLNQGYQIKDNEEDNVVSLPSVCQVQPAGEINV